MEPTVPCSCYRVSAVASCGVCKRAGESGTTQLAQLLLDHSWRRRRSCGVLLIAAVSFGRCSGPRERPPRLERRRRCGGLRPRSIVGPSCGLTRFERASVLAVRSERTIPFDVGINRTLRVEAQPGFGLGELLDGLFQR